VNSTPCSVPRIRHTLLAGNLHYSNPYYYYYYYHDHDHYYYYYYYYY